MAKTGHFRWLCCCWHKERHHARIIPYRQQIFLGNPTKVMHNPLQCITRILRRATWFHANTVNSYSNLNENGNIFVLKNVEIYFTQL
jgi:hypothetical protein